jgi:hypothetical protein
MYQADINNRAELQDALIYKLWLSIAACEPNHA